MASKARWMPKHPVAADEVEISFICDGNPWATPMVCVFLHRKDCKLSRVAARLLDVCLRKVPRAPARKELNYEIRWDGETLRKFQHMGKPNQMHSLKGVATMEGAVRDVQMRAVGAGRNREVTERAFYLATITAIMLQIGPAACETICNVYDVHSLIQQARGALLHFASEVPKTLKLDVNSQNFILVSDENNDCYNAIKTEVQIYLLSRKSLIIDFQSHFYGEIDFAVIQPMDLDWGPTWISSAGHADERQPALILDMRCRDNIHLVEQVLADWRVLKVCWAFDDYLDGLLNHLKDGTSQASEIMQNVLALQKAFWRDGRRMSLSECLDQLQLTAEFTCKSGELQSESLQKPFESAWVEKAAYNVLAVEAILADAPCRCSYLDDPPEEFFNEAWRKSQAIVKAWEEEFGFEGEHEWSNEEEEWSDEEEEEEESLVSVAPAMTTWRSWQEEASFSSLETPLRFPSIEVPPMSIHANGQQFLVISSRSCFVQGGCALTSHRQLADVSEQLKNQRWSSLFMDFQGEMMGRAGEIYFAVIKPTYSKHFLTQRRTNMASSSTDADATSELGAGPLEIPGYILDMQCQANLELITDLLESQRIKVCWDCKEALEGLMYQEHPVEIRAGIQDLVDAQAAFSAEGNLSLFEAVKRLKQHKFKALEESTSAGNVNVACWTEEEWNRFQFLLRPPDWDTFHAHNHRAVHRPFSQSFLQHSVARVLAMEAMVAHCPRNCSSSDAWEVSRSLICAVEDDAFGIESLCQLRAQSLEHPSPDSRQARSAAMKFFRQFVRVHSASFAWEELKKEDQYEKYQEICQELDSWISLELSGTPTSRTPFRGDKVQDLICRLLQTRMLTWEDRSRFREMVESFFPDGVSICHFEEVQHLQRWKAKLEEHGNYLLKQDEGAFFLQRGFLDPSSQLTNFELFGNLIFRTGQKSSTRFPGGWWGLPKDAWNSPDAETQKRALQAIAWVFFPQRCHDKTRTYSHGTFAILAGGIPQLKAAGNAGLTDLWVAGPGLTFRKVSPDTVSA